MDCLCESSAPEPVNCWSNWDQAFFFICLVLGDGAGGFFGVCFVVDSWGVFVYFIGWVFFPHWLCEWGIGMWGYFLLWMARE